MMDRAFLPSFVWFFSLRARQRCESNGFVWYRPAVFCRLPVELLQEVVLKEVHVVYSESRTTQMNLFFIFYFCCTFFSARGLSIGWFRQSCLRSASLGGGGSFTAGVNESEARRITIIIEVNDNNNNNNEEEPEQCANCHSFVDGMGGERQQKSKVQEEQKK
eukprot:gene12225-8412_t